MKQTTFILVLAAMFLNGCSSGKQSNSSSNDVIKITIDPYSRKTGTLTLSEMVESITYIPLETTDECLIGSVNQCVFSENYVLLYCSIAQRCYLFSKTGRFISQIGDRGQGPGEYTEYVNLLQIDEKNNQIILRSNSMPQKILYYDLTGRFIRYVSLEYDRGIMRYHNGFYLLEQINIGNTSYSYTILDEDFKLVTQKIKPKPFTMYPPNYSVSRGTLFCQYIYDNQMHVRENMLNDTIYRINHDFSFIPKYVVNAGKYEITVEIRSNSELFNREARNNNILSITSVFETKDYLFLSYMFSEGGRCYYHKKEDKLLYFPPNSSVPNDYDGGLSFWKGYQDGNQHVLFYSAYQIIEHINSSNKMKPKGSPEAINRFEQMSQKLDPEDNPVMMIVILN